MPTSITSSGITFDDATTLTTGVVPTANIANGAVTPVKLSQPFTLATSVPSTSGLAIDFTPIPSWVRRITVMFNGVSISGTSHLLVQLGSGSVQITGYNSGAISVSNTTNNQTANLTSTTGIPLMVGSASALFSGSMLLSFVSANAWVANGTIASSTTNAGVNTSAGSVTLSGTLDRVRITTVNGSDTFDAGTINISYEG